MLNALGADRDLFDAELSLAQVRRDELAALVLLLGRLLDRAIMQSDATRTILADRAEMEELSRKRVAIGDKIGDRFMGFRNAFGKLLTANAAGVAKLAYAADSKSAGT